MDPVPLAEAMPVLNAALGIAILFVWRQASKLHEEIKAEAVVEGMDVLATIASGEIVPKSTKHNLARNVRWFAGGSMWGRGVIMVIGAAGIVGIMLTTNVAAQGEPLHFAWYATVIGIPLLGCPVAAGSRLAWRWIYVRRIERSVRLIMQGDDPPKLPSKGDSPLIAHLRTRNRGP